LGGSRSRVLGEQLEGARVETVIVLVVNPPEPSIARRDFLVCGMEGNLCDQPGSSAGCSVTAMA
jgi:hypothetical protein